MLNMKIMKILHYLIVAALLIGVNACELDYEPYSGKTDKTALLTVADLKTATVGSYSWLKTSNYARELFWLSIYPSDDVALSGTTSNPLYNAYTYKHFPSMANTTNFWFDAYRGIYSANRVIEAIKDGTSAELDQLKGENLYLRVLSHFFLVRFFGRPYSQGAGENPGIPYMDDTSVELPSRNTVKEVYDFMIRDLLKGAELMTVGKNSCYASKETCYALLSRIYLYMEDNANAIIYANMVIDSDRYSLVATENLLSYFTLVPESNTETIFALRHVASDNRFKSAIGNQFYNDTISWATGYGETYASQQLVNFYYQFPNDIRRLFIQPIRNKTVPAPWPMLTRNGVPKYYFKKYNYQEGITNLSSPVILRLAEMYLNRAEANAKLENDQLAIDDVNLLRTRAGLTGTELYTVADLKGRASILDVVLEERQLELAFEGHRQFDLFRNNKPLIRAYIGYHGADNDHFNHRVEPTDPRVIYFIPERETNVNPNLVQND